MIKQHHITNSPLYGLLLLCILVTHWANAQQRQDRQVRPRRQDDVQLNTPPVANAGPSQFIRLPQNQVVLRGSATDRENNIVRYLWTKLSGPGGDQIASPGTPVTTIGNLQQGTYRYVLTVTDRNRATGRDTVQVTVNPQANNAPQASAGDNRFIRLPENALTLYGSGQDRDGDTLRFRWSQLTGPASANILQADNALTAIQDLQEGRYRFVLTVSDGRGGSDSDTTQVTVDKPFPPRANAGPDQTVMLPNNSVRLQGSGTDPAGRLALTFSWVQLSGPAPARLVTPSSPQTFVSNLQEGVYQFVLTVANGYGQRDGDTVKVTVNRAPNRPPIAHAGPDQEFSIPRDTTTLRGSGRDPDGDSLSYQWSLVRGPEQVRILSPASAVTAIDHLQRAIYRFELSVRDGKGGESRDTVMINVNLPQAPPLAPTADAGPNLTIKENETLILTGGGADGDGTIVAYQWRQVDGPANLQIDSPTSATTTLGNLSAGTYTFELTVTDNSGLQASDRMILMIRNAGSPAWLNWILVIAALGSVVYSYYIGWWRRPYKKVIVYFLDEKEEVLTRELMPTHDRTKGYIMGHASPRNIREMKKKGLAFRVLDTATLTVNTPGVSGTYKYSFKKGVPHLQTTHLENPGYNFVNILGNVGVAEVAVPPLPAFYLITLDGPLLPAFQRALASLEVTLVKQVPYNSYVVYVTSPHQLEQLYAQEKFGFIRRVAPYTAGDTGFTVRKDQYNEAIRSGAGLILDLVLHRKEDMPIVQDFLGMNRIERIAVSGNMIRIRMRPDTELPLLLASNKYIQAIYEHIPWKWHNDIARQLIGLDNDEPGQAPGVTENGEGEVIAVADSGIDQAHPDLQNGIVAAVAWGRPDDTSDPIGHGTHVTATIIGSGQASQGAIKGIAPGAKVFFQSLLDENNQPCDLKMKLPDLLQEAYAHQARIMNLSLGADTESYYTFHSAAIDQFVYDHPEMLVVVSAGNNGKERVDKNGNHLLAFGSIGSPATTRNGLTVGASCSRRRMEDPESMAVFSGRGPCRGDSRVKPDIVAPGTAILSARSQQSPPRKDDWPANNAYTMRSGTSMAAPIVSGAAALVREYYRESKKYTTPSALLIKATLLNGTRQLTGTNAMQGSRIIPNNSQGFGMLHLPTTIPNHQTDFELCFYDSYNDPSLLPQESGDNRLFRLKTSKPGWIRVCLAFMDNPTQGFQSDLNLLIAREGTVEKWTGNAGINVNNPDLSDVEEDFTNNIEIVRIDQAEKGSYLIEVVATNVGPRPELAWALVITTNDPYYEISSVST